LITYSPCKYCGGEIHPECRASFLGWRDAPDLFFFSSECAACLAKSPMAEQNIFDKVNYEHKMKSIEKEPSCGQCPNAVTCSTMRFYEPPPGIPIYNF
jgi:hypothetical protein